MNHGITVMLERLSLKSKIMKEENLCLEEYLEKYK